MDVQLTLTRAGFSKGEVRIYLALLGCGAVTTNTLHEKTGIERRNIYDILNKLIERGVVSYVEENKRRTFCAVHPKAILNNLEEKKKDIDRIESEINAALPSLTIQFEEKKPSIKSETFRGLEGLKTVWNDMLNAKKIFWIGSGNYLPRKLPAFYQEWTQRRVSAKIPIMHLARHDVVIQKKPLLEARYLPAQFSGQPTAICVFGNKVGTFLFGEELFVFVVESKDLADNYRAYHKYLWDLSR